MSEITDDFMMAMLAKVRVYSLVLLGRGPNYDMDGARAIIWSTDGATLSCAPRAGY